MAKRTLDHSAPRCLYNDVAASEKYRWWTHNKRHPDAAATLAPKKKKKAQGEPTWGYAFGLER